MKSPSLVYLPRSEDADYPRNMQNKKGSTEIVLNRTRFRAPSEAQGDLLIHDLSQILLERNNPQP